MGLGKARKKELFVLVLVFSLAVFKVSADAAVDDGVAVEAETDRQDSVLRDEVEQFRSRVSALESSLTERTRELKSKDDSIMHMGKLIQEKSEGINILQKEIEKIQKNGALNDAELLEKANARADELEKQVVKLRDEIQAHTQKEHSLVVHASRAEKKIEELNAKLEALQKHDDEQKKRLQKTERALKAAEEELVKAKLEASENKKILEEVHRAWLPPWLVTHLIHIQSVTSAHWDQHAKPIVDAFSQKASKVSRQAQKHIEPHWDNVKSKWLPALKEKWTAFSVFVEPHVKLLAARTIEFYEKSVSTIKPHVTRIGEMAVPYVQEAKKISKPYVDQMATVTRPHVDKVRTALNPYTNKTVHAFESFLKSATSYHHQVQTIVHEKLEKYDLAKPLATKEFVWFAASAILILPIFGVYHMCTASFRKKPRKTSQTSRASSHRRHKRRHADS